MTDWLVGYSEATWRFQTRSPQVIGLSARNGAMAREASHGDIAFAYLARWISIVGAFRISGSSYQESSALYFPSGPDRFSTRFPVEPLVVLSEDRGMDFRELALSLDLTNSASNLGMAVRNLPKRLSEHDSRIFRIRIIGEQA